MKNAKLIAVITLVVLAIVVVLQNTESVVTRFLFFSIEMPRAVLLFITLLAGFALGLAAGGKLRKAAGPPVRNDEEGG